MNDRLLFRVTQTNKQNPTQIMRHPFEVSPCSLLRHEARPSTFEEWSQEWRSNDILSKYFNFQFSLCLCVQWTGEQVNLLLTSNQIPV